MKAPFALLLAIPAVAAFEAGNTAEACSYEEGEPTIDCGGSCGEHNILDIASCANSDNGCNETTIITDVMVCAGCPNESVDDHELCGGGGCSCGPGGS